MMNICGKSRHPFLILDFRGNGFCFSHLSLMLATVLKVFVIYTLVLSCVKLGNILAICRYRVIDLQKCLMNDYCIFYTILVTKKKCNKQDRAMYITNLHIIYPRDVSYRIHDI
jgi:hypothetical protein